MSRARHADNDKPCGSPTVADLHDALKAGDLERVRTLIEAGADVRYQREHGYDSLLDAVHSRAVLRNGPLLELLALLVDHGVNLSGVSAYNESGLRVLSRIGRFDAVKLLLDAGADRTQLGWTPLMEAVALGTSDDVRDVLARGPDLEARDCWSRTAWLIAVLTGDLAKVMLLRDHGADPDVRGRCGQPPLFYAIEGHPAMLSWLLQSGADPNLADDFGTTALIKAVEHDDVECVALLLAAGADVQVDAAGTALERAGSRAIIERLLGAGADPAEADQRVLLGLPPVGDEDLDAITPDEFRRSYTRRFGTANPERMRMPFWEAMIRRGASAFEARKRFERFCGPLDGPVWSAQRYGQSLTLLSDGRAVQIGGEHEDFYDPDFCIYNDVFVYEPDRSVRIYAYPETVFPPTDFHTATLVGDCIYVIGRLGYNGTRRFGETPVCRLDVRTFRIDRLETRGDNGPGWVYKHRAALAGPRAIRVWGGLIASQRDGEESHDPNGGSFVLELDQLVWRREPDAGRL